MSKKVERRNLNKVNVYKVLNRIEKIKNLAKLEFFKSKYVKEI